MTIDVCDIYNYLGLPTLSSKAVICQKFAAAWTAISKLHPIFHLTAPDALKIKLLKSAVKMIASYAQEALHHNPTSNMLDAGHRQMIRAALGINRQNNITNKEAYTKSGLLLFSQTIQKRRLRLISRSLGLQRRSITNLVSILQNLNVIFMVWRGQGRRGL